MKIGLVGEYPTDAVAVEKLLLNFYNEKYSFSPLIKNIPNGDNLATTQGRKLIKAEYRSNAPDLLIYIRDLDGLQNNKEKQELRKKEFEKLQQTIDGVCVFMLNIYTLEALIYGDIQTFNSIFGTNINVPKDPMEIEKPKEELMKSTVHKERKYNFSADNEEVFSKLDPNKIYETHNGFRNFIKELKSYGLSN